MAKKKGLVSQAAILVLVCLIVTALLAVTHTVTEPFIAAAREKALIETRQNVFPEAETFEPCQVSLEMEGLDAVYLAYAGGQCKGVVVTSYGIGFNGEVVVVSGIDLEGKLTGCSVTEHGETPGLGTKVANEDYLASFTGADKDQAQAVDGVSGATFTTNAVKQALAVSYAAFEACREEGVL